MKKVSLKEDDYFKLLEALFEEQKFNNVSNMVRSEYFEYKTGLRIDKYDTEYNDDIYLYFSIIDENRWLLTKIKYGI